MTSKVLTEVLIKLAGGVREGDDVRLGRDADTTLFACLGNETLAIERVTSVECNPDMVIATTHRNERFVLAYEDVRAVRVGATSNRSSLVG